ncbi:MAG: SDR family oxidoreductase [Alphaproteobacteria bacterium]|nr:SDR family oxidoreductase [Alphaproteobacteria bacterium]
MRILVTGGAGFLGSHLCDRLIALGHRVTAIDNLQTGALRNLAHLEGHDRFRFQQHDVVDPFEGSYDRIFHLACPASPPKYQSDPISTLRTCFIGTDNMLRLASQCGARFFQASTSEVYGDPDVHPQVESYRGSVNPIGPRACYDEGKRIGETLCFDYRRKLGVEIKVARIFNTYGPRMDLEDGRVVSNLLVQALQGRPLTIYGQGNQSRSFCYVDDLIEGFLRLMDSPAAFAGPVNLGSPAEFTMLELARLVLEETGSASSLVFADLPADDPRQRRPDITLAGEVLGWTPKVVLREGLRLTADHFRAELGLTARPEGTRRSASQSVVANPASNS